MTAEGGVYPIFDSHAHYDDERFGGIGEASELLLRLHRTCGVAAVLDAGSSLASTAAAKALSDALPFVCFSAGIHPEHAHTDGAAPFWEETLRTFLKERKCRAVGETGLDYHYGKETRTAQLDVFRRQMALAQEFDLPVIIHDREAHADCLSVIADFPAVRGVFHSYSGSFEMAKELLHRGYYLSFNGIITFANARKTVETAKGIFAYENGRYLDRILVETDCPYLAPVPVRGSVNHSGNIAYIAEHIGGLLGMGAADFCALTYRNACAFYGVTPEKEP